MTIELFSVTAGEWVGAIDATAVGGQGIESFGADTAFLGFDPDNNQTYLWRLSAPGPDPLPAGAVRWSIGALSRDGWLFGAKMGNGRSVGIWRADSGEMLGFFYVSPHRSGYATDLAFSPDSATLATSSVDGFVRLWRIADGALLHEWEASSSPMQLDYAPDGSTIAVAMVPAQLEIRSVSSGEVLAAVTAHGRDINDLTYSPDGLTIASAAADEKSVKLWRTTDLAPVHTLASDEQTPLALAFAPDGNRLAVAAQDNTVRVWSLVDGSLERTLAGHTGPVWYTAFSADGATRAGMANDGAVRLWSSADGSELRTLAGP